MTLPNEVKERAREIIKQLDALYNAKRPGGGVHGQVIGMEPWTIRTNGDGLQCIHEAQALLDELLDPFDRRATLPQPAEPAKFRHYSALSNATKQAVSEVKAVRKALGAATPQPAPAQGVSDATDAV